jgi:hypothetical protein
LLLSDDDLSKLVDYRVQEKGQGDKARLEKIFQYKAVDKETQDLLRENSKQWKEDPSIFWDHNLPTVPNSLDPQGQMVHRYLQSHGDTA